MNPETYIADVSQDLPAPIRRTPNGRERWSTTEQRWVPLPYTRPVIAPKVHEATPVPIYPERTCPKGHDAWSWRARPLSPYWECRTCKAERETARLAKDAERQRNARRGIKRQPVRRTCLVCGKRFTTKTTAVTCSEECWKVRRRALNVTYNRAARARAA